MDRRTMMPRLASGSLLVLLALLLAPASAMADHCGAAATVTPASGPAGTEFVFETNLGAPSDLRLYRNGAEIRSAFLDDADFVTYVIATGPGDLGTWLARAEVRGDEECSAEATFIVAGPPDTSTAATHAPPGAPPLLFVVLAGVGAFLMALRYSSWRRNESQEKAVAATISATLTRSGPSRSPGG
jgi:hypothetical protein